MNHPTVSPTVLIVDDDPAMRLFLDALLAEEGYHVESAGNGIEGLQQAEKHRPQLIVSDRNMPGMDGLSMLKALRESPATRATPFIFVSGTSDSNMENIRRAYRVAAYVAKPFKIGDLLDTVRAVLDESAAPSTAVSS